MKHILTAVLLALAVAAGLLLPEVFMEWKDRELETPQLVSVTEPTLEWNPTKAQSSREEVSGAELARRLELFGNSQPVTVPVGTANAEDLLWATSHAIDFFNALFETQLEVYDSGAEYQLAWFEDGTTFPFWTAYILFSQDCVCLLNFDAESGAILYCTVNLNGHDLGEFFPESFEQAAENPNTSFEDLVAQRFCDTLGFFMGSNDGGETPVWLPEESDVVCITFEDAPDASIVTNLRVDLLDGIWFNHS